MWVNSNYRYSIRVARVEAYAGDVALGHFTSVTLLSVNDVVYKIIMWLLYHDTARTAI